MSAGNEILTVEKEFFPEAVVEYTRLRGTYKCGRYRPKEGYDLVSMAKKHLSAEGWTFYYQKIKDDRKGLRYVSPKGKKLYSLLTACEWYVAKENSDEVARNLKQILPKKEGQEIIMPTKDRGRPKKGPAKQTKKRALELSDEVKTEDIPVKNDVSETEVVIVKPLGKPAITFPKKEENWKPKKGPGRPRKGPGNQTKKRKSVCGKSLLTMKKPRQAPFSPPSLMARLIDGNVVLAVAGAKVVYRNKKNGESMKEATITREGVVCGCCKRVFTLSKFEHHAGSTNHRPSANMFLEDGRSLQECLNRVPKVAIPRPEKKKPADADLKPVDLTGISDSTCSACQLEGELILCDQCPAAFHAKCLGLQEEDLPEKWFCHSCCCRICNLVSTENSYLLCAQCENRYHTECLISKGIIQPEYQRDENWCCGSDCERVHSGLRKILGKANHVRDNLAWTLLKHIPEDPVNNKKLKSADRVMKSCFKPVIDQRDGRDILDSVIFNRWCDLPRLNFRGFYTLVLAKKESICTVVLVRIHGDKIAEIPFVATQKLNQRKGMCRILMRELEKKLMELGVEKMVLPATDKMMDTWEKKFGYSRMNESEILDLVGYTLLRFHDCIMSQKTLKKATSPEFRGEEHVYDHIDKSTISEVFQDKGSDDASPSFELEDDFDLSSSDDDDEDDVFEPNKRRKL